MSSRAGIGASVAMESAAALADVLSCTDARYVELALRLFETRRRDRVEAAQDCSWEMGRTMFVRSPLLAWLPLRSSARLSPPPASVRHRRLRQLTRMSLQDDGTRVPGRPSEAGAPAR